MLGAWCLALALDVHVKEIRTSSDAVSTTIELRDPLPDRFKKLIDDGEVLHLRIQTELWQSRPVWDRLVYPAIVRVFRLARAASGREIAVTDPDGATSTYGAVPNPMPLNVRMGKADRLDAAEWYYIHVVATVGTLADREIGDVGDAVFGRESDSSSLGSFGRLVFRKMLEISDYLQSVTAETKSRKTPGRDILRH